MEKPVRGTKSDAASASFPTDTILTDILRDAHRRHAFERCVKGRAKARVPALSAADLEDIFSDTCLKLMAYLRCGGEVKKTLNALAGQMARNLAIDRVRRQAVKRTALEEFRVYLDAIEHVVVLADAEADLSQRLERVLEALPAKDRSLLLAGPEKGQDARTRKQLSRAREKARQIGAEMAD